MRGLLAARDAILKAIVAINADMKSLAVCGKTGKFELLPFRY